MSGTTPPLPGPNPLVYPVVMTMAGVLPTPPATLLAQLIQLVTFGTDPTGAQVMQPDPGYTAGLPGSLIEDISSTDTAACVLMDLARVELINSMTPFGCNAFILNLLGQMFGIPLDAVIETVCVPRDQIQPIGSAGAFVVRNRTIPLINLAHTLGHKRPEPEASEAIAVITSISGQLGALEVDRLGERMDVMLKPVEGLLSGTPGIAGTTLMGDGRVLLILDLQELLA